MNNLLGYAWFHVWFCDETIAPTDLRKSTKNLQPRVQEHQKSSHETIEHRLNIRSSTIHQSSEKINKPPGNWNKK